MDNNKMKHHRFGILSFIFSLSIVAYVIITTIKELFFPINSNINFQKNTFIIMSIVLVVNIIGIVLGILALLEKGHKKTLAIWGIILNSLFPISAMMSMISRFR